MTFAGEQPDGLAPASRAPLERDVVARWPRLSTYSLRGPLLVLILALALRAIPWLAVHPLHHDEALYGAWARLIATGRDPLLLTTWVDKPPLTLYLIAGSLRWFGTSELALRLPGMLAGLLLVPAVYGFALRAYDRRVALAAAMLVALSPFAILFSATAFTDTWLALWLAAACWAAVARRPFVAGLLTGLAVASKQQGLFVAPLVIALLMATLPRPVRTGQVLSATRLALFGFALVLGPVTWWDSLRWHNRPSFWDRSLQTYGGLGLAPWDLWGERAVGWAQQLGTLWALPWISWPALALSLGAGGRALLSHRRAEVRTGGATGEGNTASRRTGQTIDAVLAVYVVCYLLVHLAITFQPWDRYLAPLVLPLVILLARAAIDIAGRVAVRLRWEGNVVVRLIAGLAIASALVLPAGLAAGGKLPIAGERGAYEGVSTAATLLRQLPADTIIYYRRLGWHFDFYLFDAPQERRWYGDGFKLASDAGQTARREPTRPQWLALPSWEEMSLPELQSALARQALTLLPSERVLRKGGETALTLYAIVPAHVAAERAP